MSGEPLLWLVEGMVLGFGIGGLVFIPRLAPAPKKRAAHGTVTDAVLRELEKHPQGVRLRDVVAATGFGKSAASTMQYLVQTGRVERTGYGMYRVVANGR